MRDAQGERTARANPRSVRKINIEDIPERAHFSISEALGRVPLDYFDGEE
ncbi:MAG TPA: hypothetical protein VIK27_05615 [Candidatus Aquilonibacter sp.]